MNKRSKIKREEKEQKFMGPMNTYFPKKLYNNFKKKKRFMKSNKK